MNFTFAKKRRSKLIGVGGNKETPVLIVVTPEGIKNTSSMGNLTQDSRRYIFSLSDLCSLRAFIYCF